MPLACSTFVELRRAATHWSRVLSVNFLLQCAALLAGLVGLVPLFGTAAHAQEHIITADVVYGRRAGMALTMDVLTPARINGAGIIVPLSASWASHWVPPRETATSVAPLLLAGFVVFAVRHSSGQHFGGPHAVADVRQALRFVRSNSERFAIDSKRLGAFGTSAGGHLALILGAGHEPSGIGPVQAVVAVAAPTDATGFPELVSRTMSERNPEWFPRFVQTDSLWPRRLVSRRFAPTLLIHGDADDIVPLEHSQLLVDLLKSEGVPGELRVARGGNHSLTVSGSQAYLLEGVTAAAVEWFTIWLAPSPK
jgi:fermentation-respiration switch protein FrsA (DUF1100 family)